MIRDGLICASCGGKDFRVVKYHVPRAIKLECRCGSCTPMIFFDKNENAYLINEPVSQELYEETYYGDVDPDEIKKRFKEKTLKK